MAIIISLLDERARERESERETAPPHFLTFTAAGMAAGALLRVQFTPGSVPMANLRPQGRGGWWVSQAEYL